MAQYNPPVVCLCCGKEVTQLPDSEDYEMVDSGVVGRLTAGYGSRHDGSIMQVGLCDGCIEKLTQEGKIKEIDNYIVPPKTEN
jgi:hypothetical protein